MNPFLTLFSWTWDVRDWLRERANWLRSHIPAWLNPIAGWLDTPIGWLDTIAGWLDGPLAGLARAAQWYDTVAEAISSFLSKSWLLDFLSNPLAMLNQVWSWFLDKLSWVRTVISTWWEGQKPTVQGWIDAAKTKAQELFDTARKNIDSLTTKWDNFTGTVLPGLASRLDVDQILKSFLTDKFPFYNDLVKLWDEIKAFFVNPVDFIWNKFTDWFFGG